MVEPLDIARLVGRSCFRAQEIAKPSVLASLSVPSGLSRTLPAGLWTAVASPWVDLSGYQMSVDPRDYLEVLEQALGGYHHINHDAHPDILSPSMLP